MEVPKTLLPAFILGFIFWGGIFGKFGLNHLTSLVAFIGIIFFCGKLGNMAAEQTKLWKHLNECLGCHWGSPTLAKHCRYCGERLPATEKPVSEGHRSEEAKMVNDAGGRCTPGYHLMCVGRGHKFCMMCGKNLEAMK